MPRVRLWHGVCPTCSYTIHVPCRCQKWKMRPDLMGKMSPHLMAWKCRKFESNSDKTACEVNQRIGTRGGRSTVWRLYEDCNAHCPWHESELRTHGDAPITVRGERRAVLGPAAAYRRAPTWAGPQLPARQSRTRAIKPQHRKEEPAGAHQQRCPCAPPKGHRPGGYPSGPLRPGV